MSTLQCPSCGSPRLEAQPGGALRCAHCGTQVAAARQAAPGAQPGGAPSVSTSFTSATFGGSTFVVNGQTYASPDQMPPEARAAYEQMMGMLADKNGDGVPDMLEGVVAMARGQADGRGAQSAAWAQSAQAGQAQATPIVTVVGGGRRAGGGWVAAAVVLVALVVAAGASASLWLPWLIAALGR